MKTPLAVGILLAMLAMHVLGLWDDKKALGPYVKLIAQLSITTLLMALADDHRAARYLLPLPIVGAGVSTYHLLVENGVVKQTQACLLSAPGGCATKWINEFGFVTIPTLALTAFVLVFAALLFSAIEPVVPTAVAKAET